MVHDPGGKELKIAIAVTGAFFLLELVGGYISNSLSLVSDAGHMLRDLIALLLTYAAVRLSSRAPTPKKSFGYHRTEALAAFLNGLLLLAISGFILYEAARRASAEHLVDSTTMLAVAIAGLLANIYIAYTLHGHSDINVKSAYVHVATDTVSSILVIVASLGIYVTGKTIIDPVVSVAIVVIIAISSYPILKESLRILLDYAPEEMSVVEIWTEIEGIENVSSVTDLHIWSLCSSIDMCDVCVVCSLNNISEYDAVKRDIRVALEKRGIAHINIDISISDDSSPYSCDIDGRHMGC